MIGRERILAKTASLPGMPDIVGRLYKKINDPNSSAADIESVIRTDPSLTTNLLRMANSAFFGLPRKVHDIQYAITLLGSKRVFEAATGSSFINIVPKKLLGYEIDARTYWLHSVAVAILTEQLAKDLRIRPPNLAFIAGLLHDIGKLAIGSFLAAESERVNQQLRQRTLTFVNVEREILGTDHTELGAALVERWNLPVEFVWSTRWHHDPNGTPKEADQVLVDLIHVADGLAHEMGYGADIGELQRELVPDAGERLHARVKHLEAAVCAARGAIEDMGNMVEQAGRS
jgi:putative nucleotidyltransferase with HDIG domain